MQLCEKSRPKNAKPIEIIGFLILKISPFNKPSCAESFFRFYLVRLSDSAKEG